MNEENDIDRALNDPELRKITDFNLKFRMYLAKKKLDDHVHTMEYLIKTSHAGADLKIDLLETL